MTVPTDNSTSVLVAIGPTDVAYAHQLRAVIASSGASSAPAHPDKDGTSPVLVAARAKKLGVAGVVVTSDALFSAICEYHNIPQAKAKRGNYGGSLFTIDGVDFVILPSLKALHAVPHAKFVMTTYVQKLTRKDGWLPQPEFQWTTITDSNARKVLDAYSSATFMSVDIETANSPKYGPIITMIGFTAVWLDGQSVRMHTAVIPWNFENCTLWTERFLNLPPYKALQNGKYDIDNLMHYGITMEGYLFDTIQLQHAWYAELPKDLAGIAALHVRDVRYWKDLAESANTYDKYLYNALDCYQTALATVSMLVRMPEWARENYVLKFPMVFPAILCEMKGIKVDTEQFVASKKELQEKAAADLAKLQRSVGKKDFNPNSPQQVAKLLKILGVETETTDADALAAIAYKDGFAGIFTEQILAIRKTTKLLGTYFNEDKLFGGRFLYSIIPYGTDTGRNASGEHAFWCGQNIQNIPRGKMVKRHLIADDGFMLAEVDSEQAESRDTAYISGDEALIDAVENSPDFHSKNCSAFFGVPFEELYDVAAGKVLNKDLRDIAKRVNHGANYCMGPTVLVQTMGLANIDKAKRLLKLDRKLTPRQVAEWLLARFHATYKGVEGNYYRWLRRHIPVQRILTGALGWSRYCFGDVRVKPQFNAYAAHCPQSANAIRLDEAFLRVFIDLAIHPTHRNNFRLLAQIHDSIFFEFRKGHEYLVEEVRKRMEIPVTVTGCDGKTRTYTVPAAAKAGKDGKGALRWSETE